LREEFVQPGEKKGKEGNLSFSYLMQGDGEKIIFSQKCRAKIQNSTEKKYNRVVKH